MWGLGEQWHHQLLGSGQRGGAGALLLGTQAGTGPGPAPALVRGH